MPRYHDHEYKVAVLESHLKSFIIIQLVCVFRSHHCHIVSIIIITTQLNISQRTVNKMYENICIL